MNKVDKKILCLTSIIVLVFSLVVTLLDALIPLNFWTHPILNFLFCNFVGFGVILLTLGYKNKYVWYFFVGTILLSLAFFYLCAQYMAIWLAIVVAVVIAIILSIISYMLISIDKKSIAKNDDPNYKDYKTKNDAK